MGNLTERISSFFMAAIISSASCPDIRSDGQLTLAYHPLGNSFKKLEHLESAYARTIISGEFASGAILFDDQNSDFDEGSPSERFFVELNTDWKVERDFQLIDWD